MSLIHDHGVPTVIISDGAKELVSGRTKEICNAYRIKQEYTVSYSPWQNKAEASIGRLKRDVLRTHCKTGAPARLWNYTAEYVTDIRHFTASEMPELKGRTPFEHVEGSTPDISALCQFDYYKVVHCYMPTKEFPEEKKVLGRWLGIARNCTDDLAYKILVKSGQIITRKDVWAASGDERATELFKDRLARLDTAIKAKFGSGTDEITTLKDSNGQVIPLETVPEPNNIFDEELINEPCADPNLDPSDEPTPEQYDEYTLMPR
jgi:hypothetical protein